MAQPDILFVSNSRASIVTEANIQGAPDLVVEILSPSTERYDRGYKLVLYGRHGVLEYWLVDPMNDTVEVLAPGEGELISHAAYSGGQTLASPLLDGFGMELERLFGED